MALTLFLFQVSNLDVSKAKSDYSNDQLLQINDNAVDENAVLLNAKVNFRGDIKDDRVGSRIPVSL